MMMKLLRNLKPLEYTVIGFYAAMTLMNILFAQRLPYWHIFILANILTVALVVAIARWDAQADSKLSSTVRYWYNAPLILLTFKEIYTLILPVRGGDFDAILIQADKFIFGTSPSILLLKIANPPLTELLQIAYNLFYFLPVILAWSLYLQGKKEEADFTIYQVVYGFFISYIGYFLLPAVGPRFTLHDFANTNTELPGLLFTNFLREVVNSGESIPKGTLNPVALVQRDVFPSGHTMMTLIVMYLAIQYRDRSRYFLLVAGSLLIIATVYLRYHYFVDLLGGAAFMVISLYTGKLLYQKLQFINHARQTNGQR